MGDKLQIVVSSVQVKAARGLVDMTQSDLAKLAGISRHALNNFERGATQPHPDTSRRLQRALERQGVEFISGGVRLKESLLDVRVLEGRDALFHLYDDVIETYTGTGGLIQISGVDERKFLQAGGERFHAYLARFAKLGIEDRLLIRDGDTNLVVAPKYYRWVPDEVFMQVPYMLYGDKYAIILWGPPTKIVIVHNKEIAGAYRKQFLAYWRRGKASVIAKAR